MTLPLPVIRTNPQDGTFVNLQTWFWVDPSGWHRLEATATSGAVKVTAVAVPLRVTFTTGDGTILRCAAGGTPYDLNRPPSDQFSSCTHVYIVSSVGQPSPNGDPNDASFPIKATITWQISWYQAGSAVTGHLPPVSTSSTSSLRVAQIESVQDS